MAAPKKIYTPIPDPGDDHGSLVESIKAMKETIEVLTGDRGTSGQANQTFIQRDTPEAHKIGDGWLRPALLKGEVPVKSYWDGKQWVKT